MGVGRTEQAELGISELSRTGRILGAVLGQALNVFQHLGTGKTVEHGVVVDSAGGDDVLGLVLHDAVLLLFFRSDNSALRLQVLASFTFQLVSISNTFRSSPIVFFRLRLQPVDRKR